MPKVGPMKLGISGAADKEVLRRSKSGFEAEAFILDSDGFMTDKADTLIYWCNNYKKRKLDVKREASTNMIEIGVVPRIYVRNVASIFMQDMLAVYETAERLGLRLYPFAVYPGEYNVAMRNDGYYGIKRRIMDDGWWLAGRCCGLHQHYELPDSIYDPKTLQLTKACSQEDRLKTLNSYNFCLAADSALITFTQSSPFHNGSRIAKDARIMLYRGGSSIRGAYTDLPEYGTLRKYEKSYDSLVNGIEGRAEKWRYLMAGVGAPKEAVDSLGDLEIGWNPLRINQLGTIEVRGIGMTFPSHFMATAIMLKYCLRAIQRDNLTVMPSRIGIREPFKIEGGTVYVPKFSRLWELQFDSARDGMENDDVYDYCRNFYKLSMRFVNVKYRDALRPVRQMLKKRKTQSDRILEKLGKRGYGSDKVPDDVLAGLCLHYSKKFKEDIISCGGVMEGLEE